MNEDKTVTEVRRTRATAVVVGVALPVLGGVGGWFLPRVVRWAAELRWAPFQGLLRVVGDLPDPWLGLGSTALGVVLGLLLAGSLQDRSLTVAVTPGEVLLRRHHAEVRLDRADVDAAWTEDDHLVLVSADGRELARESTLLPAARLRGLMEGAGVRWLDADPHLADYRRWVPGTGELPGGVDALLAVRARAVERQDHKDRDELRAELLRLGVVVRDQGGHQHVRLTTR